MAEILVVCTANICRSPVVEAILRARLEAAGLRGWVVSSGGTLALAGFPPAAHSAELMTERGLDIDHHLSQVVEERHVEDADLVLCMEWGHREALRVEYPGHRHKILLLSEMVGRHFGIADPIGGPREGYEEMVVEVSELIEEGLARIIELAGAHGSRSLHSPGGDP